ncbi:FecR domain-containing protein [bacterium]|nr:FecR domain-containing protein [bacterium]
MKKRIVVLVPALVVYLLLSAVSPGHSAEPQAATGQLAEIRGEIEIKKRGGKDWIAAYEGMKIDPGDQLSAGVDGHAVLVFKDSKTDILPLTQFVVGRCVQAGEESYTEMFLQIGKVSAKVTQNGQKTNKFNIVTPTSVAGVRGTRIEVSHFPSAGTEVKITEGRGMVSLVSVQNLPKAVLPILGLSEKAKAKEEKKKAQEERREARRQEREDQREARQREQEEQREEAAGMTADQAVEATPEAAIELFNEFLENTDQQIDAAADMESLQLLDNATFEYTVSVATDQRLIVGDADDPSTLVSPGSAQEADAQVTVTPEGVSATEAEATQSSLESSDGPESITTQAEQSTFSEVTDIITEISTSQGGIPPSSSLVPPALPDRTGKSNLSN